ncbi:hypothetical protein Patl1_07422 [Pistacia atlantica]|uniref:Uncharacterized protein n=1 Tax=Pistacia atlantica TaxID=434234 RepID=A0ACC1AJ70_9ROSI|nr:hypothetical protein Patl1_07422 [Pistacia atlantica]
MINQRLVKSWGGDFLELWKCIDHFKRSMCSGNGSSRSKEPLSINVATFEQPHPKLTLVAHYSRSHLEQLRKTNSWRWWFWNRIQSHFAMRNHCVKKLSEAKTQGNREFIAEMETLGKVKHQNLVPLLGYCSYGEDKSQAETTSKRKKAAIWWDGCLKIKKGGPLMFGSSRPSIADSKPMMLQVLRSRYLLLK